MAGAAVAGEVFKGSVPFGSFAGDCSFWKGAVSLTEGAVLVLTGAGPSGLSGAILLGWGLVMGRCGACGAWR